MPKPKRPTENPLIDERMDELLTELESLTGEDPAYAKTVEQLTALNALKEDDSKRRISADTALTVGANVATAVALIWFEKNHIISSKFLGFLSKLR